MGLVLYLGTIMEFDIEKVKMREFIYLDSWETTEVQHEKYISLIRKNVRGYKRGKGILATHNIN